MLSNTAMIANKNRLFPISIICSVLLLNRFLLSNSYLDLSTISEPNSEIEFRCFTPEDMPYTFTNSRNRILQVPITGYINSLRYTINTDKSQIEEIFGLNETKEFKYQNDDKYHIKDGNKTYALPINSTVLCISSNQKEIEMHLAKLIKINPIPMIKDKIFSICKNLNDLEIMKDYHKKLIQNTNKFKFTKEFFLKIFRKNIYRQNTQYVQIDRLFEEVFSELKKRFKFKYFNSKFTETTAEKKSFIEKFMTDIRNEYSDDLTSKKAAFIKSNFIKIPIKYIEKIEDGKNIYIEDGKNIYSNFLKGKSDEKIKQGLYDISNMYLELLKNRFILAENNLPYNLNKYSLDSLYFINFASFCWYAKEILRNYIINKPKEILPLVKEYINEIPGLFRFIETQEIISILENYPSLLILNEDHLNKFFMDELHRINSNEYSILINTIKKIKAKNAL